MPKSIDLPFNSKPSTCLHLDLNSCFATIEQQANPFLRGKPIAVAACTAPSGCIIAPSIEAKRLGVKVGMRVKDGKKMYPKLQILEPDPWKYRAVHLKLRQLLQTYTDRLSAKSIDEFVLNLEGFPAYERGMHVTAHEIKARIKAEIGEWLTVSIGIAPNRYLAKIAAGLHKPDGLDEINAKTYHHIFKTLNLTDLTGIKMQNASRLNSVGIYSVLDFYDAPLWKLTAAFRSIYGYYWYLRLHGWEIDDVEFARRGFSNSYALPKPLKTEAELTPIMMKLVQKMAQRLRKHGYYTQGVHCNIAFRDGTNWHEGKKTKQVLFATTDIYRHIYKLYKHCPHEKPVRNLAVSCFNLVKANSLQLDMFDELPKKEKTVQAMDTVNERWGEYTLTSARMLGTTDNVPDRIAFGGVKELKEILMQKSQ